MTVLDDRELAEWYAMTVSPSCAPPRSRRRAIAHRPAAVRPRVSALSYRGSGVTVSQATHGGHRHRPVSTAVTIALAAVAALITLWLGSLAHFSSAQASVPVAVPDQLAVVQVQAGETLQHLAGRVAPDAPVAEVVDRIRNLNQLESAAIDAGQTLIAPVG